MTEDVKDLIVVGGASAGVTAAIYGVRSGMDVLMVTDDYGGQINNTDVVENYPGIKSISGPELADRFVDHMREYEVEEETGSKVVDVRKKEDDTFEVETEDGDIFRSHAVVLATGGSRRRLNVPGEEEFRNRGVVYCAVCDGPLYQGEEVAVIGGGYAGTEAALYLSDIAEKVHILDVRDELGGEEITLQQVKDAENVDFIPNSAVKEIFGEDMVEGVKYDQEGAEKELEVTGVFIEIGTVPNTDFIDSVDKNENGYIQVNEEMETGVPGLYAAGDLVERGAQQLVVSAGQGCQAALNASEYVKEKKAEN